jgi:hypothetical protein
LSIKTKFGDLVDEIREKLSRKKWSMSHTAAAEDWETQFRNGGAVVLRIGA